MQELSCLIIEDEPLAAEILRDYVEQVPFLSLKGVFGDALAAMDFLKTQTVDVLFLDIHLPRLKGVDFVRTLSHPPRIILTTAYQEYALEGYELDVVDYLLKPISFSRFLLAVNKLSKSSQTEIPATPPAEPESLFLNTGRKKVKVLIDDMLWIESMKEYVRFSTQGKTLITKMSMKETEASLEPHQFLRIHRSFLISLRKVQAFTAHHVEINGKKLPIGRSYQNSVQQVLQSRVMR